MNGRVLITGGAGYLGSILVSRLLEAGYHVTVLDNFMYDQNSLAHVCHHPEFFIVRGDVRNRDTLLPLLHGADLIIPLAAYVGAPLCMRDPISATSVNFEAIKMMLKETSKSQSVIMPTTNSAYGSGDENNMCAEDSPLKPISQYAREKVEIERVLMEHPNATSLRLATVFGISPRMRIDLLVNDFTYRAVNDRFLVLFESHFKRNFIHIQDVARAFLHVISNQHAMKGEIYNVGLSDANLSKLELCRSIQKHIPDFVVFEAPVGKDPDQRNYIVSNAKIEATGFEPEHSLDDGIAELIKGYSMIKNTRYSNV